MNYKYGLTPIHASTRDKRLILSMKDLVKKERKRQRKVSFIKWLKGFFNVR